MRARVYTPARFLYPRPFLKAASRFDGSTGYASSPLTFLDGGAWAISFWLNWTTFANDDALAMELSVNWNNNNGTFIFDPNSSSPTSGQFAVGMNSGGTGHETSASFTRPSAGVWHHYAVNFLTTSISGTACLPNIYVDGINQSLTYGLSGYDGAIIKTFGTFTLYLMSRAGSTLFGAGSMAELAIYPYLLNASAVAALAQGGDPRSLSYAPKYYWTLYEPVPEPSLGYAYAMMTPHLVSRGAGPYRIQLAQRWLGLPQHAGSGGGATYNVSLSEAASAHDTISTSLRFNASLTEAASAHDSISVSSLSWTTGLHETAHAADAISASGGPKPTILTVGFYTIPTNNYAIIFLTDGSAVQLDLASFTQTTVGSAGTFLCAAGQVPAVAQTGLEGKNVLGIVTTPASGNGYFIWDGANLFEAGTIGPAADIENSGQNYTGAPAVTVFGGAGTGATVTAEEQFGSISQINVTDPGSGYIATDTPIVLFSGGGQGRSAYGIGNVQDGVLVSITIIYGGTFSAPPDVTVNGVGGAGSGASVIVNGFIQYSASAILVTSYQVVAGGSGYINGVTFSFSSLDSHFVMYEPGQLIGVVENGVVTSVTMIDQGDGYFSPPTVNYICSSGSGAQGVTTILTLVATGATNAASGIGTNTISFAALPVDPVYGQIIGVGWVAGPDTSNPSAIPAGTFVTAVAGTTVTLSHNIVSPGVGNGDTIQFSTGRVQPPTFASPAQGGSDYQTPPIVQFVGGGGPASATIPIMPFGVQGTDIETYVGRVWIADYNKIFFSSAESISDFGAPNGGGVFQSTDSFLKNAYIHLRQSNGFLYLIGDSSVNYVSGVTTTGTPPTTSFFNLNIDPTIGSPWHGSLATYGRSIVFANGKGVYAITGGAVQKASPQLDQIFNNLPNFGSFLPTAATAQLFSTDVYVLLIKIVDPVTGNTLNKLLLWNGKRWWMADQSVQLNGIASLEVNSQYTLYGWTSTDLFPLFQAPSANIEKVLQSKLWSRPNIMLQKKGFQLHFLLETDTTTHSPISFAATVDTETDRLPVQTITPPLRLLTASLHTAGTGYSVGQLLPLIGGTFTTAAVLQVTSVGGGGVISGFSIYIVGNYVATPASPASVSSSAGSGATFNVTFGLPNGASLNYMRGQTSGAPAAQSVGFTFTSNSPDFAIIEAVLQIQDQKVQT